MIFQQQVIAGTTTDSHGENFTKQELENFCAKLPPIIQLNTMHDMSRPASGTITNLRVIQIGSTNDWQIVGDIESNDERLGREFKGFSISIMTPIYKNTNSILELALSFPDYNDLSLLDSLLGPGKLDVSKWRKKAATPDSSAILIGLVALILKPIWEDVYAKIVKPSLIDFGKSVAPILFSREIAIEFCQQVEFDERLVEFRFLPDGLRQHAIGDDDHLLNAIRKGKNLLEANRLSNAKIIRFVFEYDRVGRKFLVCRVDFSDGTSINSN